MSQQSPYLSLWTHALIQSLIDSGVRFFCLSPGYRQTPLLLALQYYSQIEVIPHFDERGAGFHALGIAKATHSPVGILVTSGTAAANLLPAIMEASAMHLPLIAITADRPPELRGTGANQTTDQVGIYQKFVRYQVDLPCPTKEIPLAFIKKEMAQALLYATASHNQGPIHLNCMFRKPFFPSSPPQAREKKEHIFLSSEQKHDLSLAQSVKQILTCKERGVIIGGFFSDKESVKPLLHIAEKLGWPILPDLFSPLRLEVSPFLLPNYDLFLGEKIEKIDTILQIGTHLISQKLLDWIEKMGPSTYLHISPHISRSDPNHLVTHRICTPLTPFLQSLSPLLESRTCHEHLHFWQKESLYAKQIAQSFFEQTKRLSQPFFFSQLPTINPLQLPLFIANSSPVRHANAFYQPTNHSPFLFGNRGLSGIDGNISTSCGLVRGLKSPLLAVLGDLALLHDLNSLSQIKHLEHPLHIIVLNNNGGGIFHHLPIRHSTWENPSCFTNWFLTPHHLDLRQIASLFSLNYYLMETVEDLVSDFTSSSSSLIEVALSPQEDSAAIEQISLQLAKRTANCLT